MLTPKAEAYLEECRQEAVDLLIRLAQIPAPSNQEEKRAVFCREWLEKKWGSGRLCGRSLKCDLPCDKGWGAFGETAAGGLRRSHGCGVSDLTPLPLTVDGNLICCPGVGDDTACLTALLIAARFVARELHQDSLKLKMKAYSLYAIPARKALEI